MTGASKSIAKVICWAGVACVAGLGLCVLLGKLDSFWLWTPLIPVFAFGTMTFMFGGFAFAAGYTVYLRIDRRRCLRRRPLSDEQFAAQLPDPEQIDLQVVRKVRQLAAKRFRRIGGDRFYPGDRLDEGLHLWDSAPFAAEGFEMDLDEQFGSHDKEIASEKKCVTTFGDLVVFANKAWRTKTSTTSPKGEAPPAKT